jgi:type II secretion system protein I
MRARKSIRHLRISNAPEAFTLMEVVVAVIIVGMTAIATLSAFATELRTADKSRSALEAAALAEERLAILRVMPPEDLVALADTSKSGVFNAPFENYSWRANVVRIPSEPDLLDATVHVSWTMGSYDIATRMYRPAMLVKAP